MERIDFRNSLGQRIVGILHRGSSKDGLGRTIILCHGMMSSKEGTKQKAFAHAFEERGFSVLRFDFSFCGESEGKFEEITFAQELDDLRSAVRWVQEQGARPIGLLGSSMGGAVAILHAKEDPSIEALVTLAAVGSPARIADRMDLLQQKTQEWKAISSELRESPERSFEKMPEDKMSWLPPGGSRFPSWFCTAVRTRSFLSRMPMRSTETRAAPRP